MLAAKIFLLACITGPIAIAGGLEIDVALEHSLDGGKTFNKAGTIQGDFGPAHRELLTLLRRDLTTDEQDQMATLIQNNGLYQLRIPSNPSQKDSPQVRTSIPAQCLIEAGQLSDRLVIGAGVGSLTADLNFPETSEVEVWKPVAVPQMTKLDPAILEGANKLKTKAKRKPSEGGKEEEEAPEEDTRPWIVRNWMIAVPLGLVAFNVLSAIAAPAEQAAPQGRGQQAARQR